MEGKVPGSRDVFILQYATLSAWPCGLESLNTCACSFGMLHVKHLTVSVAAAARRASPSLLAEAALPA